MNSYSYRNVKISTINTMTTKHPHKLPLGCEDLDAVVTGINHVDIPSAVTSNTAGILKLSLVAALTPKHTGEGEVRVKDLNPGIIFYDIQLAILGVDDQVFMFLELQRFTALTSHSSKKFTLG